jgi:hypothetical protein
MFGVCVCVHVRVCVRVCVCVCVFLFSLYFYSIFRNPTDHFAYISYRNTGSSAYTAFVILILGNVSPLLTNLKYILPLSKKKKETTNVLRMDNYKT